MGSQSQRPDKKLDCTKDTGKFLKASCACVDWFLTVHVDMCPCK